MGERQHSRWGTIGLRLGALTIWTAPYADAAAQTTAHDGKSGLAEIVVTANKRSDILKDLPASVWVAPARVLEQAQIRDFDDLPRISPALTITKTTQPANNSINIRGIGTYAYSIATKPSVSVVVDDVAQAFQAQAFSALLDVAQIEVLRGPQSTLFGVSATAGVINITTRPPTTELSAGLQMTTTDDHDKRLNAYVSGPLGDRIAARLAVGASDYRGNIYNVFRRTWVNGHNDVEVRGKLVWDPTPDWTFTASPYWRNTRASCCASAFYAVSPGVTYGRFGQYAVPYATALGGVSPHADNRTISADIDPRGDSVGTGGAIKLERRFGASKVVSITSWDTYRLRDLQDTDGTAFNWGPGGANLPGAISGGSANGGTFKIESISQEVKLYSPEETSFRYLLGLAYSRVAAQRAFVRGSNTLTAYGNLLTVPPTTSLYTSYYTRAYDTNYAIYGQATYRFLQDTAAVLGARISHEDMRYRLVDRVNNVSFGTPRCDTTTPSGLKASTCNSYNAVTGRVALQHDLTAATMVFGGYDRGKKGAAYDLTSTFTVRSPVTTATPNRGFPIADAVAAQQPVSPETVDAFQLGVKSALSSAVDISLTLYDETFHKFQAQSRDQATQQNILNSIGRVTSRGAEMELSAQITTAASINFSGAYNAAKIEDFKNAPCFPNQTAALGCSGGQQDLSGKRLFDAPRWNMSLSGTYDIPISENYRAVASANWRWQSSVYHSLLQDPNSRQAAYGLLNLSLGFVGEHTSVTVFCINAFDKSYSLSKGRDGNWNINPYGSTAGPLTDAVKWAPGRDSRRYLGIKISAQM